MDSPRPFGNLESVRRPRVYIGATFAMACAFLLCSPGTGAQTPGISGTNVVMRRISTEQGLSDRTVYAITQDRQGFIWLGTNDGLNRFDGQNFTVYRNIPGDTTSLSHDQVRSLCEDSSGYLWVGTGRGLNRFDPVTRHFRRYLYDPHDSTTISDDEIRSIYQDRGGVLWVGTARGLNRLEARTGMWVRFSPEPLDSRERGYVVINCMLEDRAGTFWIGTGKPGGGLYAFDRKDGTFTVFPESAQRPRNSFVVSSLYEDASGTLWIGWSHGRDFCAVDRRSGKFQSLPLPLEPGTGAGTVICFAEDSKGILWIGTWSWGLFGYDRRTGQFAHCGYEPSNPRTLPSPDIYALFQDKSGLLWVGTNQGGVTTVARNPFLHRTTLGTSLSIARKVDGLMADREGNLWIGSISNGIWRYDTRLQKATRFLPDRNVAWPAFQDREGRIWILSNGADGIFKYDPHSQKLFPVRLPAEVRSAGGSQRLFIDSEQSLWVSFDDALYRFSHDLERYERYSHEPENPHSLTGGGIYAICEDGLGRVWVATDRGLNRFDKTARLFTRYVHDATNDSSLSSNNVIGLCVDHSGSLWVGTEDGLNRFNEETDNFTRFFPSSSRSSRSIGQIVEDRRGCLWFATGGGIVRFDPSLGQCRIYDERTGVESVDFIPWCSPASLPSGELVFGCTNGIFVFLPDSIKGSTYVPPIVITGIAKFDQPVLMSTSPELLQEITLEHGENVFSVGFAALSYERPDLNQYAYKLVGFDRDWIYCSNRREASYTNLDPGLYAFRVKGSNHADVWNEAGTTLTVIIKPAYWQTWWFRLLGGLVVLGVAFALYRRKLTHLQQEQRAQEDFSRQQIVFQEAERKRIAAELHDGLGQDLLIAANEIQEGLKEKEPADKRLHEIASLIAGSLRSAREIASNLHPHQLDRLGLSAAIEALARTLAKSSSIPVESASAEVDGLLSKETELHLYRIIQEALSNAVRHAKAKHVRVIVERCDGLVRAVISDDGLGFDPTEFTGRTAPDASGDVARGFGLASMAERTKIIGGTLTIDSARDSGTRIIIVIPCGHTHADIDR